MKTAQRSLSLDLLRIFAAFWVVGFHWIGRGGFSPGLDKQFDFSWWPDWVSTLAAPGFLGVDIFFILSGTVIAKSAVGPTWQQFSQNRFLRLFPVYLLATIAAIALVPIVDSGWNRALSIASISGLQFWIGGPTIIGTAWTLAIEVQFYALVALCILLMRKLTKEKIRNLAFVLIALSILTGAIDFEPINFLSITPWGGYFALGALLSTTETTQDLKRNTFGILIAMVLAGNNLYSRLNAMYPEASSAYRLGVPFVILLVVTFVILTATIGKSTNFRTMIEWRGIATLSLMTYPIYLFHEILGLSFASWLNINGLTEPQSLLFSAIVILLASWLSVRWFEPFSRRQLRNVFSWK